MPAAGGGVVSPFDGAGALPEHGAVSSQEARDLDVIKARRLADLLTKLADKLELPRAELEAGIDPALPEVVERGGVAAQADAVLDGSRNVIRRLHDAWLGLDADRENKLEADRRSWLLRFCFQMGDVLRQMRGRPGLVPDFEANLAEMVVRQYAENVPDHAEQIQRQAALVRALVVASADDAGMKWDVAAELCSAMNYGATVEALKKKLQRQRDED